MKNMLASSRSKNVCAILLCLASTILSNYSFADNSYETMIGGVQSASRGLASTLAPTGLSLCGKLFLIQFALNNIHTIKNAAQSGEILHLIFKVISAAMWFGFLCWLINSNFEVLNAIYSGFSQLGSNAAGGTTLSPDGIMQSGIALQNNMIAAFNEATGANQGMLEAIKFFLPSVLLSIACLIILLSFFIMALAIAMATLEFYLIVAVAPIAYALGGLDAFKNNTVTPIQCVISIGFRLLIIGTILGVVSKLIPTWSASFASVQVNDWTPIWTVTFSSLFAAVASFSAGKIAASLASGQSNLSGNDAMFASMQIMNTAANMMTAMNTATQLALGGAGAAAHGANAGVNGLNSLFGGGSGAMRDAGTALSRDSMNGMPGGSLNSQVGDSFKDQVRASSELLGGLGQGNVPINPGDASSAGIGGNNQPSESHLSKLGSTALKQMNQMHAGESPAVHVNVDTSGPKE